MPDRWSASACSRSAGSSARGEKILDVVPERDSLIIEAQINVDDISDVHPDMRADVHLTAYKARITPVVRGKLAQVSADRLTDNRTGTVVLHRARAGRSKRTRRFAECAALPGNAGEP